MEKEDIDNIKDFVGFKELEELFGKFNEIKNEPICNHVWVTDKDSSICILCFKKMEVEND